MIVTKRKIFFLFFSVGIFYQISCNNDTRKFEIILFFEFPDENQKVLTIEEKDIVQIDWRNQLFFLEKKMVDSINSIAGLAGAKAYFSLQYDKKELYQAFIYSIYSSNKFDSSHPFVTFHPKPYFSLFEGNALKINYVGKDSIDHSKEVFDPMLYNYLVKKNKIIR